MIPQFVTVSINSHQKMLMNDNMSDRNVISSSDTVISSSDTAIYVMN